MTVKLLSMREPYRHMYTGTLRASSPEHEYELPFQFSDMSGRFSLGRSGDEEIGWNKRMEISDIGLELVLSQIVEDSIF